MKRFTKAAVLISGLIVHGCAAVLIVHLFNRPGILYKLGGVVFTVVLFVSLWWLIHSMEE